MKIKDTDPGAVEPGSGGKRRDRGADRKRAKPHRKLLKSPSGRRKLNEPEILVNKDYDAAEGAKPAINHAASTFTTETLKARLIEDHLGLSQQFIRDVLKEKLLASGSRFVAIQQGVLHCIYAVGWTIDLAPKVRRDSLLWELGCNPNKSNIFLELTNLVIPIPAPGVEDRKARRLGQNRNSEYGRGMQAAQALGIEPQNFIARLNVEGGIQAMAEMAREQDRQARDAAANSGEAAETFKISGLTGGDQDDWNDDDDDEVVVREGARPESPKRARRAGGRKKRKPWDPNAPRDDSDQEWVLKISAMHAGWLIRSGSRCWHC